MSEIEHVSTSAPVTVDIDTLKYLGYDPANVATRALVLLAHRYQLDPLLGEIMLISDSKGRRLYVTRDGMLTVAHASGQFDGMDIEQRRNTEGNGYTAYVTVWRKDMSHPIRMGAQCKDTEPQARAGHGPEMALARAMRRALKVAFRIRSDFYPERPDVDDFDTNDEIESPAVSQPAAVEAAAREASTRPPAPPSPDEFIAMTREQEAQLKRLRVQLGLMARENAGAWLTVLGRSVGREIKDAYEIDRREADSAIEFLTAELAAQAQALADAARVEAEAAEEIDTSNVYGIHGGEDYLGGENDHGDSV